jgi:hypothetical protein
MGLLPNQSEMLRFSLKIFFVCVILGFLVRRLGFEAVSPVTFSGILGVFGLYFGYILLPQYLSKVGAWIQRIVN